MTTILRCIVVVCACALACLGAPGQDAVQGAAQKAGTQANANVVDLTATAAPAANAPATLKDPPSCPADAGGEIHFQEVFGGSRIVVPAAHPSLKLEVTNLSNYKPAAGDSLTADIRITNTSGEALTIPWSGDRSVVPFASGAKVEWVQAEIDLTIRSPQSTLTLESPVNTLYGVKSKPETWKTLAAGESATVRLEFKVDPANAGSIIRVTAGNWDLTATWSQAERILFSNDCKYESGWWFDTVKNEPVALPIEVATFTGERTVCCAVVAQPAMVQIHVTLASGTDGVDFDNVISAALRHLQGVASVNLAGLTNSKAKGNLELRFAIAHDGAPVPGSVEVVSSTLSDDARDVLVKTVEHARSIERLPAEFDRKSIEMKVAYAVGPGATLPPSSPAKSAGNSPTPVSSGTQARSNVPYHPATGVGANIVSPTDGVDFSPYLRKLVASVRSNWIATMPESVYLGAHGEVHISFTIERNGSVRPEDIHIDSDNSGKDFGDVCKRTILNASPYEPLPDAYHHDSMQVRFGFFFNTKPPLTSGAAK
jgi:hypothetical protein